MNVRTIQAVAPNILKDTDSVVVSLIIAMDAEFADTHDPDSIFGISNGASFVSFKTVDKLNYGGLPRVSAMKESSLTDFLQAKWLMLLVEELIHDFILVRLH